MHSPLVAQSVFILLSQTHSYTWFDHNTAHTWQTGTMSWTPLPSRWYRNRVVQHPVTVSPFAHYTQAASLSLEDTGAFASADNIMSCISYIQSAAAAHGVVTSIDLANPTQGLVDACNALYALLQRMQQFVEQAERRDEETSRLHHSLKMARQANVNLQTSLQDKEKEMGSLRNHVCAVDASALWHSHLHEPQVNASMRDEVQARDKLSAQQRDLARKAVDSESKVKRLTAELKRKDVELTKTQDKLRELLESKGSSARQLRELNSALQARTSSMGAGREDEARVSALREAYEAKYKALEAKHSDLQSAYSRLQDTYKGILFQQMRQRAG